MEICVRRRFVLALVAALAICAAPLLPARAAAKDGAHENVERTLSSPLGSGLPLSLCESEGGPQLPAGEQDSDPRVEQGSTGAPDPVRIPRAQRGHERVLDATHRRECLRFLCCNGGADAAGARA